MTDSSLLEAIARGIYAASPLGDPQGAAKGYKSPRWMDWDEATGRTPGERERCLAAARAALSSLEAAGYVVVREEKWPRPSINEQTER